MGIHALLTTIAPIRETVTVWRRCKGANVGVDAFGWLHQLAMNHYEELVHTQLQLLRSTFPLQRRDNQGAQNAPGHLPDF